MTEGAANAFRQVAVEKILRSIRPVGYDPRRLPPAERRAVYAAAKDARVQLIPDCLVASHAKGGMGHD